MISDVSCDTDRGGYYNPNSSRDGGVGAPTGGAMRRWLIVDAVAVRVASSGSSLTSSAVTTAVTPSDDDPRAGAGSQPPARRCTRMALLRMVAPMRARMMDPEKVPVLAPYPMSIPNHPKSASPKVVLAELNGPRTLRRKAGRKVHE